MSRWMINVNAWSRGLLACAVAAVVTAGTSLVVSAQTQQQEFIPYTGPSTEAIPAATLVMSAYAFVWVALVVYIFLLWRRLGRVEHELADVNSRLATRK